jgi:hypothetical protein
MATSMDQMTERGLAVIDVGQGGHGAFPMLRPTAEHAPVPGGLALPAEGVGRQ